MSFFSNILRGTGLKYSDPNPANGAMQYLNQIPGMAQQNLSPYMQQGHQAQGVLNDLYAPNNEVSQGYRPMASNPLDYVNEIMRGYEPSRGYQYKQGQMSQAMRNSANAGGFTGTQFDQQNQAENVRDMLGEDMQQFLANILGTQQNGLSGLERMMGGRERTMENTANRGFNAASDLTNILGSNLGQQAGMAFQGQRQQNFGKQMVRQNRMGLFKDIAGMMYGNPMASGGGFGGWGG